MPKFHQNLTQSKQKKVLREVIITANKEKKPVSALRSGLKPMDTPQKRSSYWC
jgi:hypothetical protein